MAEDLPGISASATAMLAASSLSAAAEGVRPEAPLPSDVEAAQPKARLNSTERSRAHRARKRNAGGELLSFVMGPAATSALAILCAHNKHSSKRAKSQCVEAALVSEALKVAGTGKQAHVLAASGLIDEETLRAWLIFLDASFAQRRGANGATGALSSRSEPNDTDPHPGG